MLLRIDPCSSSLITRLSLSCVRLPVTRPCVGRRYFRFTALRHNKNPSLLWASAFQKLALGSRAYHLEAGSVIAHNSLSIDPADILSKLKPLPLVNHDASLRRHALILVTKGFAGLAEDDSFVRQAIDKMFGSQAGCGPLDVRAIIAVVDRLATLGLGEIPEEHDEQEVVQCDQPSMLAETRARGFEGLTYLADGSGRLLTYIQTEVDERPAKPPPPRSQGSLSDETSILSLQLGGGRGKYSGIATIELPLADTLFINGRRCTLQESHWRRGIGESSFDLIKSQFRTQVLLSLTGGSSLSGGLDYETLENNSSDLSLPIIPLTRLRKITDSMGNVIRKLQAESEIGASTELEQSIAEYFTLHDIPPQRVNVWAIVVPQRLLNRVEEGVTSPERLLWMGATLHRVLSGGGGWGSKAGLTSLDPNTSFVPRALDTPLEYTGFAGDGSHRNDQPIAQPGDYLAFYVLNPSLLSPAKPEMAKSNDGPGTISIELGVLPDPDDDASAHYENSFPSDEANEKGENIPASLKFINHCFGALSEKGISLQTRPLNASSQNTKTKIDVPFTRFKNRILFPQATVKPLVVLGKQRLAESQKRGYFVNQRLFATAVEKTSSKSPLIDIHNSMSQAERGVAMEKNPQKKPPIKFHDSGPQAKSDIAVQKSPLKSILIEFQDYGNKAKSKGTIRKVLLERSPIRYHDSGIKGEVEGSVKKTPLKDFKVLKHPIGLPFVPEVKFRKTWMSFDTIRKEMQEKPNVQKGINHFKISKHSASIPSTQQTKFRSIWMSPKAKLAVLQRADLTHHDFMRNLRIANAIAGRPPNIRRIQQLPIRRRYQHVKQRYRSDKRALRIAKVKADKAPKIKKLLVRRGLHNVKRRYGSDGRVLRIAKVIASNLPKIRKLDKPRIRTVAPYEFPVRGLSLGSTSRKDRSARLEVLTAKVDEIKRRRVETPWDETHSPDTPEERIDDIRNIFKELMSLKPGTTPRDGKSERWA